MFVLTLDLNGFDYRHMPSSRENIRDGWNAAHKSLFSPKNVLITCGVLSAFDVVLEAYNLSQGGHRNPAGIAASLFNIGGVAKNVVAAGFALHHGYKAAETGLSFAGYVHATAAANAMQIWGALKNTANPKTALGAVRKLTQRPPITVTSLYHPGI